MKMEIDLTQAAATQAILFLRSHKQQRHSGLIAKKRSERGLPIQRDALSGENLQENDLS